MMKYFKIIFLLCFTFCSTVSSQGTQWSQIGGNLTGESNQGLFGWNLSLNNDGSILGVSSSSEVNVQGFFEVYDLINGSWSQKGSTVYGSNTNDSFGFSFDMNNDGTRVGVGSIYYDLVDTINVGAFQIFDFDNGLWSPKGNIFQGGLENENFGYGSVISPGGDYFVIGSPGSFRNFTGPGNAYVYKESNNVSTPFLLVDEVISGDVQTEKSASEVDITPDGNTVIISSEFSIKTNVTEPSLVKVFTLFNGEWTLKGNVLNSPNQRRFGDEVKISDDGNTIAIASNEGIVTIYTFNSTNNTWVQKGNAISHSIDRSVSMDISSDGNVVAVGGRFNGGTVVYQYSSGSWSVLGNTFNYLSWSVALNEDGTILATVERNITDKIDEGGIVRVYSLENTLSNELNTTTNLEEEPILYPNPAKDVIKATIDFDMVNIYNSLGQKIQVLTGFDKNIDVSDFNEGFYLIEFYQNSKIVFNSHFIKK